MARRPTLRATRALGALSLGLALTLSACGSDTGSATGGGETASESVSSTRNDADVMFAQMMIPHHRQAVEMAQLAQERATSPEVKALADKIEAAQDPEIQTMTGWLEAWGEDVPTGTSMGEMDMGSMSMPGMMTEQDMADLENAQGAEFDRMFLTMMIKHHQGAIEMAQAQQADGENPEAVALAEKIEADQTAEIKEIERILAGLEA